MGKNNSYNSNKKRKKKKAGQFFWKLQLKSTRTFNEIYEITENLRPRSKFQKKNFVEAI